MVEDLACTPGLVSSRDGAYPPYFPEMLKCEDLSSDLSTHVKKNASVVLMHL